MRSASALGASPRQPAVQGSGLANGLPPHEPTIAIVPAADSSPAWAAGIALPSTANGAADHSAIEAQARARGVAEGRGNGRGGASKRAVLVRLYDEAGAAGDRRHNTREGVGPMAKDLHHRAGLAQASTARNYLHDLLDQRGIPRRGTGRRSAAQRRPPLYRREAGCPDRARGGLGRC
jgi:hypothetical protein